MTGDYSLTLANKKDFNSVFEIMDNSFPSSEMRNYRGQLELLDKDNYKLYLFKDKQEVIAFLGVWEFDGFEFVEHFAVDEDFRGNGAGSKALKEYLSQTSNMVILEVEEPNNEIAKSRVQFYQRAGFHYSEYGYIQPKLQEGVEEIELKCMSYPKALDDEKFKYFQNILYSEVYNIDAQL